MKVPSVTFWARHPSHRNWRLSMPPSRCPLDGRCLSKIVPPRKGEKCECGEEAVVVIIDLFATRSPLCLESWSKP
jgi:hypothetical protein